MSIKASNQEACLGSGKKHSLIFHRMGLPFMGFRFKCEPSAWFRNPQARQLTENLVPHW